MATTSANLDRRITLQSPVITRDAAGQQIPDWQDVASVWASVRPLPTAPTRADVTAADQIQASSMIRVQIRLRAGVLSTHRVMWDGRAWGIVGEPIPIDRAWLRFDCQSSVRDAR